MLENLTLLAVLIIILWIISLAYYLRVSQQQKKIQQEIEAIRALLAEPDDDQENAGRHA